MVRIFCILILTQLMSISAFAQEKSVKDNIKSLYCLINVDSDFPSYTELQFDTEDTGEIKPVQYIFLDGLLAGQSVTVDIADILLDQKNILSISTNLPPASKVTMNTIINLNTKEGTLILKSKTDSMSSHSNDQNTSRRYPLINCKFAFVK